MSEDKFGQTVVRQIDVGESVTVNDSKVTYLVIGRRDICQVVFAVPDNIVGQIQNLKLVSGEIDATKGRVPEQVDVSSRSTKAEA